MEFLGLEESTRKTVESKLEYLPDGQLHYCAADIKKAGFPDAAVNVYVGDDRRLYTVVTVVEPKHADEVIYRAAPDAEIAVPASWVELRKVVHSGHALDGTLYRYGRTAPSKDPPAWFADLRERRTEADYQKALEVLKGSRDSVDRAVAAMVLMNFADRDGVWQALAGGLRDADNLVGGFCGQALSSLRTYAPRKVDWAPATADLAPILRGTNLFAFQDLLRTLAATGVEPVLAAPLLGHGGGHLVLAYLRALHEPERKAARALLVQLHGSDLGDQPAGWEAWLSTL